MALTVKEIENIALVARLYLSEEEKELFTDQLNSILTYVDKLKELDTENIEPLTHILPDYNVFRSDEVIPSPSRDELMANSALIEDGYYKVPRII